MIQKQKEQKQILNKHKNLFNLNKITTKVKTLKALKHKDKKQLINFK